MTTYSTSFDSYTADVQPSDWTARWVTTTTNWLTKAKAGTEGGQVLENTGTGTAKHLVTWDAIDADANRADVEILARVRPSTSSTELPRLTVRGSGAAGAENCYCLTHTSSGQNYQLQKFVAGTTFNLGTSVTGFVVAANAWYYIRLRVNGTTLSAKVWKDGFDEPSAWTATATDSSVTAAGWTGIGNQVPTGTRDIDWFSVGTNGDTAPLPTSTATQIRVSQAVTEAIHATVASARVSQLAMEAALQTVAQARVSQLVTEVAISDPIAGNVSQMVIEVAFSNAVAVPQQPRMIVLM
jgi:hypothetical protein